MSANSDVKLIHGAVVIDAWDLQVNSPDRHTGGSEHRRALVHDFQDGLTINWDNDYPGGVKINAVRLISKDPNFVTPVTIAGGLAVKGGDLHVVGQRILMSDEQPAVDFANGEIYQNNEGLQVSGGRYDHGTKLKPVSLHIPIAKKTIKWGNLPAETANRAGNRARSSGGELTHSAVITLAAGLARANTAANTVALSENVEFDIVDTFIQILDELSELRERVAELEANA